MAHAQIDKTTAHRVHGLEVSSTDVAPDNGLPTRLRIGAPSTATITQGMASAISGTRLYENNGVVGKTYSLTLSDANGVFTDKGTGTITGSGTNSITFTGSMSQVNHDLLALRDTSAVAGADTIRITAMDLTAGISATAVNIAVTVNPPAAGVAAFAGVMAGHGGAASGAAVSTPHQAAAHLTPLVAAPH